jgi:hypothetical protein
MFARGFLSLFSPPPHAPVPNSPKSNVSPTYTHPACNSFVSPTYAKTEGWGPVDFPASARIVLYSTPTWPITPFRTSTCPESLREGPAPRAFARGLPREPLRGACPESLCEGPAPRAFARGLPREPLRGACPESLCEGVGSRNTRHGSQTTCVAMAKSAVSAAGACSWIAAF